MLRQGKTLLKVTRTGAGRDTERTGKKIPLQEGSDDLHTCAEWEAQHRKYYNCRDCGKPIYFDDKHISENGKHIPLSKVTGEPHQCNEAEAN